MAPVETEYYDLVSLRSCNFSLYITHALLSSMTTFGFCKRRQLNVPTDVNDTELKKAYRRAAMKVCLSVKISFWNSTSPPMSFIPPQYHPDKNPSPDAEEKFKGIRYNISFRSFGLSCSSFVSTQRGVPSTFRSSASARLLSFGWAPMT